MNEHLGEKTLAKLDFSQVEEFVPVPEGRYLAEIAKSAEGLADRSGQKKWSLQLQVVEAPEDKQEFIGKTIQWDMSLQPKALWKVKQTLAALGQEIAEEDTEFDFEAALYIGRQAVMIVGLQHDETYGDRTRVNRLALASTWVPVPA